MFSKIDHPNIVQEKHSKLVSLHFHGMRSTALILASQNGHDSTAKMLIEAKANIHAEDKNG